MTAAVIHGIGVGPGDPDLLTLKAARLIAAADLVAYPAPEAGESFARAIVAGHLKHAPEEFAIRMNIGDGAYPKDEIYDAAAARIGSAAASGRRVVILCEGDPFLYGSFMYLHARLAARHRVEIVPGVSSITACAAIAGRPLAAREEVLSVIPASLPAGEIGRRLADCDAAALMKLGRHLGKVRALLDALGLTERAHFVAHAGLKQQRSLPLRELEAESAPYFSMILVRKRDAARS